MSDAIVVLSGGADSTICLFIAKKRHEAIHALTLDYDQRHSKEIEAAKTVGILANVASHEVLHLGPVLHGRSPLISSDDDLETYGSYEEMAETIGDRVEITFVPTRNLLFLTLAINRAVCMDITDIYTGVCFQDGSNYPDCRRSFINSLQHTARLSLGRELTDNKIEIHTPLMDLTKAQSVEKALTMKNCYTALGFTHTAYSGEYPPVTQDHASVLRARGFEESMVPDPLIVRAYWDGLCQLPTTRNYTLFKTLIEEEKLKKTDSVLDHLHALEKAVKQYKTATEG